MAYSVTTMIPTKNGFAWWVIEIEGNPPIEEVHRRLVDEGQILVTKVDVENGHLPGTKQVVKRTNAIIAQGIVGTIMPLHVGLIEAPVR